MRKASYVPSTFVLRWFFLDGHFEFLEEIKILEMVAKATMRTVTCQSRCNLSAAR